MAFVTQKISGLLTYPTSSSLPVVPYKESWVQCPIMNDQFQEAIDKLLLNAPPPF